MRIFLVGMMGSGKSTVGKKLAESLLVDFHDLDKIIEAKLKKNIKDIFEEDGEGFFRDIENKSLIDFQNKTKFVLATGGGIITNEGSRNFLSKERTYFLDGSEEILYERSTRRREFRPLMKDMDIKGFSQLLKKRRQYYIESSIATIDIDKKNIKTTDTLNSNLLKKLKLIDQNSIILKILGSGAIKDKINIEADLASKSAVEKLEKIGGSIQLKK